MSLWTLELGEVANVLAGYQDNVFDAVVCDPPYGLRFMNKQWDYDVPTVATWRECLRVLKPGAPLVAFGGSRTYHRLACGIEDAGFELRDCLMWLHGKGFPKSQDVGKAVIEKFGAPVTAPEPWLGYGTALKPAHEPITLARKPLQGIMAANVAVWGVGGLAIDACRIGTAGGTTKGNPPKGPSNDIYGDGLNGACDVVDLDAGRWPANLLLSHTEDCRPTGATRVVKNGTAVKHNGVVAGSGASFGIAKPVGTPDAGYGVQEVEVWECAEDCPVRMLDAEAGDRPSTPYRANEAEGAVLPFTRRTAGGYADAGGPSRFFYCAKVSTKEREAGCEGLPKRTAGEVTDREDGSVGLDNPRAGAGRTGGARNHHPTLKPLALTTWLARLLLPPSWPGRAPPVVLVPFAGAGSEMIGCLRAGWGAVVGIEREADYATIARARLGHWCPESEAA